MMSQYKSSVAKHYKEVHYGKKCYFTTLSMPQIGFLAAAGVGPTVKV